MFILLLIRLQGSFCEYRRTNDVKQKKQKTENNSTPKQKQITMSYKQKKDNVLRYLKKDPFLFCTSCKRVLYFAQLAFHSTAPHELTSALDLFVLFHRLRPQITRFAKRFAFLVGSNVTCAFSSQHSKGASSRVSYTVVWGGVKINQLVVFPSYQSVSVVVVSFLQFAVVE